MERHGRRGGPTGRVSRGHEQRRRQQRASHRDSGNLPAIRGDLLYGRNAVAEALRGRRQPYQLLLAAGIRRDAKIDAIEGMAAAAFVPKQEVPRDALDQLTNRANHQGVALDASTYPYADTDLADGQVLIALDHLQDPQNVGTLLRAAEACGVGLVLIPSDRAAEITPAVVNASSGAVEHLPISRVTNLSRELDSLKQRGWWVIGLEQGEQSSDIYHTDVPLPAVVVIGAEANGLSPNVRRRCDLTVHLPMRGKIDSLNAATAGAVALFHLTAGRDD